MKLENKVAIITGGASGIGEETARCFALNGVRGLVIADIQQDKGQQVAESIGLDRCHFIKCDVSDEEQVRNLVDSTIKLYGQLDIMFSNAGTISPYKQDILNFNVEACDRHFAINVRGMIACVKHAGKAMVDGGIKGSIICTGSLIAIQGTDVLIDFNMSKHAVLGLVKCASKGLGKYGIRVNCVSPGPVPTPLAIEGVNFNNTDEFHAYFQPGFTLKRKNPMTLTHVADAVLFLASDNSEFVTGHNLAVDGGHTSVSKT